MDCSDKLPPLSLSPKHIIVRMPNWLGDLVMATPILTDLRHHWPEAKITASAKDLKYCHSRRSAHR